MTKEEKREYDKLWRLKNYDRLKIEGKIWRDNNKDKRKKYNDNYIKSHYIQHKLSQARNRALKKGLEFNINIEDIEELIIKQNNKCAYSNIIFSTTGKNYTMSIDRIDSKIGYIKDNIQLLCTVVNMMKNNLEEIEFKNIITEIYAHL